jgi:hypothetical protein
MNYFGGIVCTFKIHFLNFNKTSLYVYLEDRTITEAEKWEMRDLEAKHPSLKRGGEFSPSCRPRYNRG